MSPLASSHEKSIMSRSTYNVVTLASRPKSTIIPGETFKMESRPMIRQADVKEGQILVETLYLSLDPAMRGWLNDARSYVPPVQLGEIMRSAIIGRVLVSRSSKFPINSYVSCAPGWTEYSLLDVSSPDVTPLTFLPATARPTDALGVLGMTGLTAYFGLLDVGQVRAGDLVVVSGAAGATGSVVCQIAKLKGARVLGIAGSEEKVRWLRELGCDDAVSYRSSEFKREFREKTSAGIDVFFDNVGGEQLDLALGRAKPHARFVMCGDSQAISQYNTPTAVGPRNLTMVIAMRIRMQGFIVFDYAKRFPEARAELARWLVEGRIKRRETIVRGGLEAAERALMGLYEGANTGKMIVEVRSEEGDGRERDGEGKGGKSRL